MMTMRQIKAALKAKKTVVQTTSIVRDGVTVFTHSSRIMGVMMQNGSMLVQSLEQPGQWYGSKDNGADISVRG